MKFLIATYGERHIGMLLAHLHSLSRSHPGAEVEVYHQELPAAQREAIAVAYPHVEWIETAFNFAADRIQRISSKTLAWEQAFRRQRGGELLCFLDVDTLVLRDLHPFFADPADDVIFTWKDERFVLNTGVMLCRVNERSARFFTHWRENTLAILRDPARYAVANDSRLPYGAADQMALHEMLGFRLEQARYAIELGGDPVRFRGEPCEVLNETNSRPITSHTHIIHYKGGWQPILLDGRRFTKHRPRAACSEMYRFYLATFKEALARVNERSGARWRPRDFHLHIPSYSEQPAGVARSLLYALHVARDYIRSIGDLARGVFRVIARRFHLCRS